MIKRILILFFVVLAAMPQLVMAYDQAILRPVMQYNGRYGYVSPTGQLLIPARYDNAMDFREGLAAVERSGKWGYIDQRGHVVVKLRYETAYDFNRGYGIVKLNGKWGAVNSKGELEIPCDYERVEDLLDLKVLHLSPEQASELKKILENR